MRIMAFDPGGTTGVAVLVKNDIRTWQIKDLLPVWGLLQQVSPHTVVCESFHYQRRDKVDLTPVEVIGVIRLWCDTYAVPLIEQTPATGKKFWSNDKLKKTGLWSTTDKHAMDALRHLLYYITFEVKDLTWIQMLKEHN